MQKNQNQKQTLPKKTAKEFFKEVKDDYIHWKHAVFGKKPEETPHDEAYKKRLDSITEVHELIKAHWAAADTFF